MSLFSRFIVLCLVIFSLALIPIYAQDNPSIISPNIFLRGMQLENGVRYTAAFIKPSDDMALRNLSVEITLPANAIFTEMLVSRQVQFDVIRRNRQGQLTLIWQISRVDGSTALDSFSFTVAAPLETDLEFFMLWQNEQGQNFVENFTELVPVINATENHASIIPQNDAFSFVGNTGIQVASPFSKELNFHLLNADFNPPAEYGALWWCSLLELDGLSDNEFVIVIVPLRRPVAPFIELDLFQEQDDGSWLPLEEKGVVTADGQYVMYRHSGGLIASGGDEEIRQDAIPAEEVQIVEAENNPAPPANENPVNNPEPQNPVVQPEPAQNDIANQAEFSPVPQNQVQNPIPTVNNPVMNTSIPNNPSPIPTTENDGRSNTIVLGEATTVGSVQDGTSNTVIIGEVPVTSIPNGTIRDGTSNTIVIGESPFTPTTDGSIQDGTSNTIVVSEVPFTPTPNGTVQDGTSNTVVISEITSTPSADGSIQDGTSNTIVISEVPFTPTTDGSIQDGTSNTIVIGESPFTPTTDGSIQDGTSNTIVVSESPFTPTPNGTVQDGTSNTIVISEVPFTPTPNGTVQDGTSNTIVISEITATPTLAIDFTVTASSAPLQSTSSSTDGDVTTIPVTIVPTADNSTSEASQIVATSGANITPSPEPTLGLSISTAPPFGSGGTRVVIFQTSEGDIVQCQVGFVQCAVLNRGEGTRQQ